MTAHWFGIEEQQARVYRGYNPAFVRRVWANRREAAPAKKTIGQILAERAEERSAKLDAERVSRLKAMMERGDIQAIIAEVALEHRVTVEDILGHGMSHPLIRARHQAIVEVAIRRPALSLKQIGKFFRRDHTTILHVLQKYRIRSVKERA